MLQSAVLFRPVRRRAPRTPSVDPLEMALRAHHECMGAWIDGQRHAHRRGAERNAIACHFRVRGRSGERDGELRKPRLERLGALLGLLFDGPIALRLSARPGLDPVPERIASVPGDPGNKISAPSVRSFSSAYWVRKASSCWRK